MSWEILNYDWSVGENPEDCFNGLVRDSDAISKRYIGRREIDDNWDRLRERIDYVLNRTE